MMDGIFFWYSKFNRRFRLTIILTDDAVADYYPLEKPTKNFSIFFRKFKKKKKIKRKENKFMLIAMRFSFLITCVKVFQHPTWDWWNLHSWRHNAWEEWRIKKNREKPSLGKEEE